MMRIIAVLSIGVVVAAGAAVAQAPESQPVGTMREFMTSVVYPPTNELLLSMNRGAPASDSEWAAVQRSAIQLAESGNVMMMRGRAIDQGMWLKEARALVDVGAAAYKAARAKDAAGLRALEAPLNASCVNCHKQYRPNVHPQPQ